MAGAERAPWLRITAAPTSSSSAVVTPGRTSCFIASRTRLTASPAALSARNSSSVVIDILSLLSHCRATRLRFNSTRSEKDHQDDTSQVEGSDRSKAETHNAQNEAIERHGFA